jgi:hypothetical protein
MTDKLNLVRLRDTDVKTSPFLDQQMQPTHKYWVVDGATHYRGDHIGVVVHTTQDTDRPDVALSLRCVIADISHDTNGVPIIKVRPADVHTLVLNVEPGPQDFHLKLNDSVMVIKQLSEVTASPELVEAAQLQAGIDPARRQAYNDTLRTLSAGVLFGGPVPKPLSPAEMLSEEQAIFSIYGIEHTLGDHLEVLAPGDTEWSEAYINALIIDREQTQHYGGQPCYIVAVTEPKSGVYGYLMPDFKVRPIQAKREEAAREAAAAVSSTGYSAADLNNVALVDKLMAGVDFSQARQESLVSAVRVPKGFFIQGIQHLRDDLVEISTNGLDWDSRRINAISYTDGVLTVVVDGACEGDSSIVLNDTWFVRAGEALRSRCLLAKRAESIPAGAGAQAYASDSGLFKRDPVPEPDVRESAAYKEIDEGITVDKIPGFSMSLKQPGSKSLVASFQFFGMDHHPGEYLEVFYPHSEKNDSGDWKEHRIVSVYCNESEDSKCAFDITVQCIDGNTNMFKLMASNRIRLTKARREALQHQLLKEDAQHRGAAESAARKYDIRFGADAATASGASVPGPSMFRGRAFGDAPSTGSGGGGGKSGNSKLVEITWGPDGGAGYLGLGRPVPRSAFAQIEAENKKPYTAKDLMEHTGMAGLALSSMLREDIVLGDFRQAIKQFATGVETLVLGRPGRGFE